MKRIDTATRVQNLFGAGKDGFRDGDVAAGFVPTDFNAKWPNGVQEEILNVIEASGQVPSGDDLSQLLKGIRKLTGGTTRVAGLVANNNPTTPNTQYIFSAAVVTMRDPATGAMYSVLSPASKTNNVLTAGPVANGRDQAAAFTAGGVWIHFYYIFNPSTESIDTISSLSATGPAALPAGYTAWAYIGAVRMDGANALLQTWMRGSWVHYTVFQSVLASGSATVATNVNTAVYCPPNALNIRVNIYNIAVNSAANGAYSMSSSVGISSGGIYFQGGLNGAAGASTLMSVGGGIAIIPNVNQNYVYFLSNITGSGAQTSHAISGYQVPNGGE